MLMTIWACKKEVCIDEARDGTGPGSGHDVMSHTYQRALRHWSSDESGIF